MCTTSCTIECDGANEYYRPGEVIKGLVILNISGTSTIFIKALSLQLTGYASTKWEKPNKEKKSNKPEAKIYIESREDYISTTSYLIGSELANPKPMEPAKYTYSFMVHLPQNIPSTFNSSLGFIRYDLIVNADYGDHSVSLYSSPIHIEEIKDLRTLGLVVQLPKESLQLEQKSCVKFWQQPLQLYVRLPQSAYVVGECISLHAKVTNLERLRLLSITSNLNRIVTYKGFINEKKPQSTIETTTVVSKVHSIIGKNSNVVQHLEELIIPKTFPSMGFDECKYISLSYEVEVLVTCENTKRSVRAAVPIVMGTVSLKSDVKIVPLNVPNNNVASITVATSMEQLTLPQPMDLECGLASSHLTELGSSMSSLASSFQEAEFMTSVKFNKKSKHHTSGDLNDFKPKYLYYDLPEGISQNDTPTTSQSYKQQITSHLH